MNIFIVKKFRFRYLFLSIVLIVSTIVFLLKSEAIKETTQDKFSPAAPQQKNYVLGEIMVGFTDDSLYEDAINLIESKGLEYELTYKAYQPSAIVKLDPREFSTVIANLKQDSLVADAKQDNPNRDKIFIKLTFGTAKRDIDEIVRQNNLELVSFLRGAFIKIYVPEGQEQKYIEEFKLSPIVSGADLNHLTNVMN